MKGEVKEPRGVKDEGEELWTKDRIIRCEVNVFM